MGGQNYHELGLERAAYVRNRTVRQVHHGLCADIGVADKRRRNWGRLGRGWRKTVRIEHTNDFNSRRTVLKTAPNTSPDCLPFLIVAVRGGGRGMEGDGGRRGRGGRKGTLRQRGADGYTGRAIALTSHSPVV